MKRIRRIAAAIVIPVFLASCATGPGGGGRIGIITTPEGRFAQLPKGLNIQTRLDNTLSTRGSRVGQAFSVSTAKGVCDGSTPVIPAGTKICGSVTKITPPRFGLMKAKMEVRFERIVLNGRSYRFPGKAGLDINAYAGQGAKQLGEMGAKKAIKYFIPAMGTVFLIMDISKAVQSVREDKEISIEQGSTFIVKLTEPVRVPLN